MERSFGGGRISMLSPEEAASDLRLELVEALAPFRLGVLGMPVREMGDQEIDDWAFDDDEKCGCEMKGFEEHVGIVDQDVARMLGASLPRPWTARGGIRALSVEPHEETSLHAQRGDDGIRMTLRLGDHSWSDLVRSVLRAAIHSSDWHSPIYGDAIRRELARLMHDRVSSSDHTPFVSVSSLPFQDVEARARKYWVELLASALSVDAPDEQGWVNALSQRLRAYRAADARRDVLSGIRVDIATIRRVYALIDATFVPWRAAQHHLHLLHHAVRTSHTRQAESCLHELPDDLRSAFALGVDRVLHGPATPSASPSQMSSDLFSSFPSDLGYGFDIADRIHHSLAELAWLDDDLALPSRHPSIPPLRSACRALATVVEHQPSDVRIRFADAIAMRDPGTGTRHLV